MDIPKSLASEAERTARAALLSQSHIRDLADLVGEIRQAMGPTHKVPHFDPLDGGIEAEVLFLLEAPGPRAVRTGFVSRSNPDETAKNFYLLNEKAGIDRRRTVMWNAVPWYIGTGTKIRPATRDDVRLADEWLKRLLTALQRLRFVMFVGQKALHAQSVVTQCRPAVEILTMPHPSPLFVNRSPENRERMLEALRGLATRLSTSEA
jgi:uracil-DNA glycosylase